MMKNIVHLWKAVVSKKAEGELRKTASELSPADTKTDIRAPLSLHHLLFYNKADEESVTCLIIVNTLYLLSHCSAYKGVRFS